MTARLALALAALALSGAPARAATTVAPPAFEDAAPVVAATNAGVVAAWVREYRGFASRLMVRRIRPDGAPGAAAQRAAEGLVAIADDGTAAAVRVAEDPDRERVVLARLTPAGDAPAEDLLDAAPADPYAGIVADSARIAAAPDGTFVVAWVRIDGDYRDHTTQIRVRRVGTGGALGPTAVLDVTAPDSRIEDPLLAAGPGGVTLVAWKAATADAAALVARAVAGDGIVGEPAVLAHAADPAYLDAVAGGGAGPPVLAWRAPAGDRLAVQAARAGADGRIGTPALLAAGGTFRDGATSGDVPGRPAAAVGPDGTAWVAWQRAAATGPSAAEAGTVAADGTPGAAFAFAFAEGYGIDMDAVPALAGRADGQATVAWAMNGLSFRVLGPTAPASPIVSGAGSPARDLALAAGAGGATAVWAQEEHRIETATLRPDGTLSDVAMLSPRPAPAPRLRVTRPGAPAAACLGATARFAIRAGAGATSIRVTLDGLLVRRTAAHALTVAVRGRWLAPGHRGLLRVTASNDDHATTSVTRRLRRCR